MLVTKDNLHIIYPNNDIRVIKDGKVLNCVSTVDTKTLKFTQLEPIEFGPPTDNTLEKRESVEFKIITGIADEIQFIPRSES